MTRTVEKIKSKGNDPASEVIERAMMIYDNMSLNEQAKVDFSVLLGQAIMLVMEENK